MAIRICENQRYGLIDEYSQSLLSCDYHDIGIFRNGLAKIRKNSLWGLVDEWGTIAVPIQYDKIKQLSSGLIKVKKNGKYGLLDNSGKMRIPCEYRITQLNDTLFKVEKDGLYGLYDISGNRLLSCEYDLIEYQRNDRSGHPSYTPDGWFRVRKNGLFGIVDPFGHFIIPCKFHKVTRYGSVFDADGHQGWYVPSQNYLYPCEFYCPKRIREGLISIYREGELGILDTQTHIFTPNAELGFGYRRIAENGKWGILDKDGNTVTACQWDRISDSHDGVFAVKLDGKWGLLDGKGNILAPCLYDAVLFSPAMQNLRPLWDPFKVKCNGKWGILDLNGEIVIPCVWDDVIRWSYYVFGVRQGKQWHAETVKKESPAKNETAR